METVRAPSRSRGKGFRNWSSVCTTWWPRLACIDSQPLSGYCHQASVTVTGAQRPSWRPRGSLEQVALGVFLTNPSSAVCDGVRGAVAEREWEEAKSEKQTHRRSQGGREVPLSQFWAGPQCPSDRCGAANPGYAVTTGQAGCGFCQSDPHYRLSRLSRFSCERDSRPCPAKLKQGGDMGDERLAANSPEPARPGTPDVMSGQLVGNSQTPGPVNQGSVAD